MPGRSTKVSEKLVLIPETVSEKEDGDDEAVARKLSIGPDEDYAPLMDD